MEDLWVVLIIVLVVFLIIAVVAVIVLVMRLESLAASLGIWGISARAPFTSIAYPPSMPSVPAPDVFDVEVALLGVGASMSASNIFDGSGNNAPLLPSYLSVGTTADPGVVFLPTPVGPTSNFQAVVAFRDLFLPSDFVTDLDWSQVPYHGLGNVHAGLAQVADNVYSPLRDALVGHSPVLFCGHGPGGGVAALVAARLSQDLGTRVYLYTSSYPRVGDLTWQNNLERLTTDWWVLTNISDVVPEIPFPAIIIENTPYAYATPTLQRQMFFDYQAASPSVNENPATYQHMLVPARVPPPSTPPIWTSPLTPACP